MREILFKAKRLSDGEWVEGLPTGAREDGSYYIVTNVYGIDERFGIGNRGEYRLFHDAYRVDPSTVCEYTGLTDKNGKKIFEGDIIHWTNWNGEQKEASVCYDQEWNRFCVWLNGAESMGVNIHLSTSGIEIVGNKFDGGKDDS